MRRSVPVIVVAMTVLALVGAGCSSPTASPIGAASGPVAAGATADTAPSSDPAAAGSTSPGSGSDGSSGLGEPVQLTLDPCTLITQDEAAAVVGIKVDPLKMDDGGNRACNYLGVGAPSQAHLLVSVSSVAACKLLFAQIDRNLFGGDQTRVDGIGDGGMLVTGGGTVWIAVHHGCFELDGATADTPLPDATMLDLARTATGRVP